MLTRPVLRRWDRIRPGRDQHCDENAAERTPSIIVVIELAREHPGQRDEAWFKREIAPKLYAFTLKEIAEATGLSLAACSRIRAGAKVPHPRPWEALIALAQD
jgi:hypothetical protein